MKNKNIPQSAINDICVGKHSLYYRKWQIKKKETKEVYIQDSIKKS